MKPVGAVAEFESRRGELLAHTGMHRHGNVEYDSLEARGCFDEGSEGGVPAVHEARSLEDRPRGFYLTQRSSGLLDQEKPHGAGEGIRWEYGSSFAIARSG